MSGASSRSAWAWRCTSGIGGASDGHPRELITDGADHALNPGWRTLTLVLENSGDRRSRSITPMSTIGRRAYAEIHGPTVGDRVRLADTEPIVEVEQDCTLRAGGFGVELEFGGGKTIRDGMGQSQRINGPGAGEAVDCVVTTALILDHWASSRPTSGCAASASAPSAVARHARTVALLPTWRPDQSIKQGDGSSRFIGDI